MTAPSLEDVLRSLLLRPDEVSAVSLSRGLRVARRVLPGDPETPRDRRLELIVWRPGSLASTVEVRVVVDAVRSAVRSLGGRVYRTDRADGLERITQSGEVETVSSVLVYYYADVGRQ